MYEAFDGDDAASEVSVKTEGGGKDDDLMGPAFQQGEIIDLTEAV